MSRAVPASPVVVVGSVNVDVVVRLPALPSPGETVTGGTHAEVPGGKGGNQAVAAARLGATTHLVARVGDDDAGRAAVADLRRDGVRTDAVLPTQGARTGLAVVLVDEASENLIGVSSGANHQLTAADVDAALADLPAAHAVVAASLEVPLDAVLAAAAAAARRGWPFVLNPAPAQGLPDDLLRLVSVLTPNEHELDAVAGALAALPRDSTEDVVGRSAGERGAGSAEHLLGAGVGAVVTTRGARGVQVVTRTDGAWTLDGREVAAVDTTGAGDTFTGALARAIASGDDLRAATRYANAAAALSTTAAGARAGMPDHETVLALLGPEDGGDETP